MVTLIFSVFTLLIHYNIVQIRYDNTDDVDEAEGYDFDEETELKSYSYRDATAALKTVLERLHTWKLSQIIPISLMAHHSKY